MGGRKKQRGGTIRWSSDFDKKTQAGTRKQHARHMLTSYISQWSSRLPSKRGMAGRTLQHKPQLSIAHASRVTFVYLGTPGDLGAARISNTPKRAAFLRCSRHKRPLITHYSASPHRLSYIECDGRQETKFCARSHSERTPPEKEVADTPKLRSLRAHSSSPPILRSPASRRLLLLLLLMRWWRQLPCKWWRRATRACRVQNQTVDGVVGMVGWWVVGVGSHHRRRPSVR